MATATDSLLEYTQQTVPQQSENKRMPGLNRAEITPAEMTLAEVNFVPMTVDVTTPVRKVIRALQWRRQLLDALGGIVSGAVSLR